MRGSLSGSWRVSFPFAAALLALSAIVGCSDDKNPVNPGGGSSSTQMTGTFAGGGEGGLLSLTISTGSLAPALRAPSRSAHDVQAVGTLSPEGGGVISLSGTYDPHGDSLNVSGQGYTFVGVLETSGNLSAIVGEYTGPHGDGMFGCTVGGSGTVKVYCGSYVNADTTETGRWNVVIRGEDLAGIAFPDESAGGFAFRGSVSGTGTMRSLAFGAGTPDEERLVGEGTWNTIKDQMSGTWRTLVDILTTDEGTWSGELCIPGNAGPD